MKGTDAAATFPASNTTTFFTIASTTACTCGLLDVIWHFVFERPRLEDSRFWLLPLAALALTCFFACGIAYLAARLFFRRGHPEHQALATGVATGLTLFLISTGSVFSKDLAIEDPLLLIIYISLVSSLSLGGYFVTKNIDSRIQAFSWARKALPLLCACPFVLYLALGLVLHRVHNSRGLFHTSFLIVLFLLAALLLLVLYWRSTPSPRATAVGAFLLWITFSALWAALSGGPWPGPVAEDKKGSRPHRVPYVLLLTVDTLRADHLGAYGAPESPTPNIDRLAAEGILFQRPLSPAPWTLPAFASIMTGVSPSLHKMSIRRHTLPMAFATLAEHLREAEYQTAGLGKNVHLKEYSRLSQGFDQYQIYPQSALTSALGSRLVEILRPGILKTDVTTTDLTSMAKSWLAMHAEKDFFFWLHYFDPHIPYAPPSKYLDANQPPVPLTTEFSQVSAVREGSLTPTVEQREWIHKLYKKEIRHIDDNIGQVMGELQRLGIYDQTLIVFTSDHGEEFWDHGGFEHGHTLYDELLHVPLIIKLPSVLDSAPGTPRIVDNTVSTESIMATILELCGIPFSGDYSTAGSLRRFWATNQQEERGGESVISTSLHYDEDRIAVSFGQYKYIRPVSGQGEELYDLVADPLEQQSIAAARPDLVEEATKLLQEHGEQTLHWARVLKVENTQTEGPDKQASEELRALGYIN